MTKNSILSLIAIFFFKSFIFSQSVSQPFPNGASTDFANAPFGYAAFKNYFCNQIITKQELNAAGINGISTLKGIQFSAVSSGNDFIAPNQLIFLQHYGNSEQLFSDTNYLSNPKNPPPGFFKVLDGSITWPKRAFGSTNWEQINFTNDFVWNGFDNLLLTTVSNGISSTNIFAKFVASSSFYAEDRLCVGGGSSMPSKGTLLPAAILKRFVYLPGGTPTSTSPSISAPLGELFSIFPNPSNDLININFRQDLTIKNLQISDALGRVVETISGNTFRTSSLPNGIYHVAVTTEEGRFVKPFIVAH